jgi:sugar/nucleoside kinase (ribokinase family)
MILAVGNPVYDYIETPEVSTKTRVLSGCSTNACLALSKLGESTTLVGCVGRDFRRRFTVDMGRHGISYRLCASPQTGGFSLVYDHKGDRTLDILGVASPIAWIPDVGQTPRAVIVGPVLGEVSFELVAALRERFHCPLFLDVQGLVRVIEAGRVRRTKLAGVEEAVGVFDVAKPNEYEATVLTGLDPRREPRACVEAVHAMGCRVAVVTLAEAGSVVFDGEAYLEIPAYPVKAVDPTGAGDTYLGGFVYQYLRSRDLTKAACFASAVASAMVEHTGPDFPLTLEEAWRRTEALLPGVKRYGR